MAQFLNQPLDKLQAGDMGAILFVVIFGGIATVIIQEVMNT
jgi:hypothetical protein